MMSVMMKNRCMMIVQMKKMYDEHNKEKMCDERNDEKMYDERIDENMYDEHIDEKCMTSVMILKNV